ncbi:MAG: hypothetical protein FWG09_03710 [Synergistaceae bacterium]|nr:hypothetical protein [Synergistaceae bacterium]
MKKLFALTLALMLALPLAAGGEPAAPPSGDNGLVWADDYWRTGLRSDSFARGRSVLALEFYSNGEFEYRAYWTDLIVGSFPNQRGGDAVSDAIYKGTYSVSDGTLTFTFKSAQYKDSDTKWNWTDIALPADLSLPYKLWDDRYEEYNVWDVLVYTRVFHKLDIGGPLPGANGPAEYGRDFHNDGYTLYLKEENDKSGSILNAPEQATFSWTGKWETTNPKYYGAFDFVQNGNTVTGACDGEAGDFTDGTVSGNTLTGSCDGWELRLTMSPDGERFRMERMSSMWLSLNTEAVRVR